MSTIVFPQGDATVTLTAGQAIAVASYSTCQVYRNVGFPQYPPQLELLGSPANNVITVFGTYANGATIVIDAGATEVLYNVGTDPTIPELIGARTGALANALDSTAAATSAAMLKGIREGIITSTTAAGVTLTLPTGAVLDAAITLAIGDQLVWIVVNTGPNSATVTASAGHTVFQGGAVTTLTQATFRTVKTAASTFVTYRG